MKIKTSSNMGTNKRSNSS